MKVNKPRIIVAITTFDLNTLNVSVPPLRRFGRQITLVIHNDNPARQMTEYMVRKMRPWGKTYIINSEKNFGELESRLRTIEFIRDKKIPGDWIVFLDDDDVLIDAGVPNVDSNTFAVIQNATTISDNFSDVFKISPSWTDGTPIGKTGPHFEITGTTIRANILFEFTDLMRPIMPYICKILSHSRYRVPISAMMWSGLNTMVRTIYPTMSAIYMNRTNYVSIHLGHAKAKYGKTVPTGAGATKTIATMTQKFNEIIGAAAMQNMVAPNN